MTGRAESIRVMHPLFHEGEGGSIPTSALQLRFWEVDLETARNLNRLWHSRLPRTHKGNLCRTSFLACFAAEFDGIYFAAAIWTNPIAGNRLKDGERLVELRRLAIAQDAPKNTATRMLGWMTREIKRKRPDVLRLISYQDTEVHTGTIYKAAGWERVDTSDSLTEWNVGTRNRPTAQSAAPKIRWEREL